MPFIDEDLLHTCKGCASTILTALDMLDSAPPEEILEIIRQCAIQLGIHLDGI